jgi:hypothetical protein
MFSINKNIKNRKQCTCVTSGEYGRQLVTTIIQIGKKKIVISL